MNEIRPTRFLAIVSALVLLFCGFYVYVFSLQVGAPVRSEFWVKPVIDYKNYYARNITQPKLIISSGSNALFGINSKTLESELDLPVVNLAVHAGLTLNFLYKQLQVHVSKGDIVVMPLEFFYYFSDKGVLSKWFVTNILSWGKTEYLDELSTIEYLSFIANTPKQRILNGLYHRGETVNQPSLKEIRNRLRVMHKKERYVDKGYSYLSLTKRGDMLPAKRPTKLVYNIHSQGLEDYQSKQTELDPDFFVQFNKIKDMVEEREATLILTWPVTIKNPSFDLTNAAHQEYINGLVTSLENENIQIECAPGLFNLNYKFFFNTKYHLNAAGAALRTELLGNCLTDVLSDKRQEFTFESSRKMLDDFEAKYDYGPSGHKEK